ncbi:MAG: TVP38/TMEM64 family protein [Limisphaerales bacterium]
MTAPESTPPSVAAGKPVCGSCQWRKWAVAAVVVLALATVFTVFDVRGLLRDGLAAVEQLGAWGPVLFVVIYVLACVLFIPGSVLTLGAGAVFGVVWGSAYVSLASTLGATASFLVGRYLARRWVARKIAGNATFAAIDQAVAAEGWKIVGLTRLSPVFPFTLLNYAFGVTRVSLRDYVLASWIGMMPGTVMYVYLGSLARAGAGGQQKTPAEWALYSVGLAATIAVTVVITRIARQALARRTSAALV